MKTVLKTEQAVSKNEKVIEAIHDSQKDSEAITALQVLGYTKKEIEKALEKIDTKTLSVEEIIKKSLSFLGK